MTPMDFAHQFFDSFSVKGDEIVPRYCPICNGGAHRDKHTFALNTANKTYNCKRGSCNAKGLFSQLCEQFGVKSDDYSPPLRKTYKQPEKKPGSLHQAAEDYLKIRGIGRATAEFYGVGTDDEGNLLFPFYDEDNNHVFNKFRLSRKLKKGEQKAWREKDTKPVLFGMHRCDTTRPLTICEGELDAMACHEAGIPNAVSVPSGAEDFTWLDTCWDFVQQFQIIYLFGDNDTAGQQMIRRLIAKLSDKQVFVVEHDCKDANELLYRKGKQTVYDAWNRAKEVPVSGLLNLADVAPLDITNMQRIRSGISKLNQMLGGFLYGDVSVWTGRRGEGKSTILSELCLDAIDDGKNVCAYSGELRADRFQYWVDLQAAGFPYIREFYDHAVDRNVYYVPKKIRDQIHAWYDRKFWLYDNTHSLTDEESSIISIFEKAAKRYDCRMFLVDNLMTADTDRISDKDYIRRQSLFVGQLVKFANLYNVHVHLVAHPRKTDKALDADSVGGSGDITNRVANVLALTRLNEIDSAKNGFDTKLDILKNRWEGKLGNIGLKYCPVSNRLYVPSDHNTKQYGWEFENWNEIEDTGDLPF